MARTAKDVVEYFPHDAGASESDTLQVLQSRFGNNGYAFWFKLLEKLASTDGHFLDCRNPIKWNLFIAKMGVDEITTVEILNLLVEMQAIDGALWSVRLIWCQKLVDNVSEVYRNRKREIPQKPITTIEKPITTPDNTITCPEIPQSKVKYSRVNKSKLSTEVILPEWLNKENWDAFLEMRKNQRAVPTTRAIDLLIKELTCFKDGGQDPNLILNQSIMNNWKGVFALKGGNGNGTKIGNGRGNIETDGGSTKGRYSLPPTPFKV